MSVLNGSDAYKELERYIQPLGEIPNISKVDYYYIVASNNSSKTESETESERIVVDFYIFYNYYKSLENSHKILLSSSSIVFDWKDIQNDYEENADVTNSFINYKFAIYKNIQSGTRVRVENIPFIDGTIDNIISRILHYDLSNSNTKITKLPLNMSEMYNYESNIHNNDFHISRNLSCIIGDIGDNNIFNDFILIRNSFADFELKGGASAIGGASVLDNFLDDSNKYKYVEDASFMSLAFTYTLRSDEILSESLPATHEFSLDDMFQKMYFILILHRKLKVVYVNSKFSFIKKAHNSIYVCSQKGEIDTFVINAENTFHFYDFSKSIRYNQFKRLSEYLEKYGIKNAEAYSDYNKILEIAYLTDYVNLDIPSAKTLLASILKPTTTVSLDLDENWEMNLFHEVFGDYIITEKTTKKILMGLDRASSMTSSMPARTSSCECIPPLRILY